MASGAAHLSPLCLFLPLSDLSEQIKAATKENHIRAENTQLMLSYQRGQISATQYKVGQTRWAAAPGASPLTRFRPPGAALFPLRGLQGSGGGAGPQLFPSRRGSHLLPPGAGSPGVAAAGPGALPGPGLEEEGDRSCRHTQIHPEAP